MSDVLTNSAESTDAIRSDRKRDFSVWHSNCILHFARIEGAIGDMLSDVAGRDPKLVPKNAYTLGGKVKALSDNIKAGSPFADGRKTLRTRLAAIEPMLPTRNILCHAYGDVLPTDTGGWIWTFQHRPNLQEQSPLKGWIDDLEAGTILKKLTDHDRSIQDLLRNWRGQS